jgi:hypothetical protein
MKKIIESLLAVVLGLVVFFASPPLSAAPRKTEAELIRMLQSRDYHTINDALDRLPAWYPHSTNAVQIIRGMLRSNAVVTRPVPPSQLTTGGVTAKSSPMLVLPPPDIMARLAAKALGKYHAALDEDELGIICNLLDSQDEETVMDALKALRGLKAPQAVPKILPLLKSKNAHVVRDSCRTLAMLGDKSIIPSIEPLLKDSRADVRKDAQDAIDLLSARS